MDKTKNSREEEVETTAQFLSRVQMLEGLPEEARERLCDYLKAVELAPEEKLFSQGEKGQSLYIVRSGAIDILTYTDDGRTIKAATLGSGECFGELSALDNQLRSASAAAAGETVLLELSGKSLKEFMSSYPLIAKNLLMLLCDRIRVMDVKLISFEWQANVDKLTGLYNRRWFDTVLEQEFKRSQRYDHPLSLLMLDIDRFKDINDTHGHVSGDLVLRQVSGIIRRATRSTDFPARYGGEEFAIVLPETQIREAISLGERIRRLMQNHIFLDFKGKKIGMVTISIGADEKADHHQSSNLIDHADQALYLAKNSGRNCVKSLSR